jgi:hypothetical protein
MGVAAPCGGDQSVANGIVLVICCCCCCRRRRRCLLLLLLLLLAYCLLASSGPAGCGTKLEICMVLPA